MVDTKLRTPEEALVAIRKATTCGTLTPAIALDALVAIVPDEQKALAQMKPLETPSPLRFLATYATDCAIWQTSHLARDRKAALEEYARLVGSAAPAPGGGGS